MFPPLFAVFPLVVVPVGCFWACSLPFVTAASSPVVFWSLIEVFVSFIRALPPVVAFPALRFFQLFVGRFYFLSLCDELCPSAAV